MIEAEQLLTEIDDLERKVADAGRSARPKKDSDRSCANFLMLEQELLALKQQLDHAPHGTEPSFRGESPTYRMNRKLDSALSDSFPGSDAVSFLEPAPNTPAGWR